MIYQNIEIHNAVNTYEEEEYNGIRWLRVPRIVEQQLEKEQAHKHASGHTGVEFRFLMESEKVILRLAKVDPNDKRKHSMHVFFGGIQGGWQEHEVNRYLESDVDEIVIHKPENLSKLHRIWEVIGTRRLCV